MRVLSSLQSAAGPRGQRVTLGRWGAPLLAFSALAILGSFGFAWGVVADDLPTPPGDMTLTLLPLSLVVSTLGLLATARIVGSPDGYIDVVGLLATRRIPIGEIAEVMPSGPLEIRMTSGRRIGSIAYGRSLLGDMVGYPRSRQAAERIYRFCEQVEVGGPGFGHAEYSVRLRGAGIVAALLLGGVLLAGTLLLHQL
ncbi:hypothetical protein [Blastococcus sp. LR1]|uniref:hypothetical protein n=1 Tax=Blastococcus sp. LR1 TaxID=2877000 RepID=UPI001CCEA7AB|nr:hypothetical protein [Blastococcus sp. LR1]MCA0146258.1 hypothetical protein [Blastococcus sp. LR1]